MFHYKKRNRVVRAGAVLISSLFISANAVAQTSVEPPAPTPTPAPPPTIEKVVGKPVSITWWDGRQAVLETTPTINDRLPLPIELSENTCDSARRVQCEYKAGLGISTYRLAWKVHPDPARIGQTLRLGNTQVPGITETLSEAATWTMVDGFLKPEAFKDVMSDELTCTAWDWLGRGPQLPSSLNIANVSTEFMLDNPNTGQLENKTIMTTTDVLWNRTPANSLQVQSIGLYAAMISLGVNALFIGDVMRWTLEKSVNQYCDIGFKVDVTSLRVAFEAITARSASGVYAPVLYTTEEPFSATRIAQILKPDSSYHQPTQVYE